MRRLLLSAAMAGVVGLSGCASMNKDECMSANWRDIGLEDGMKGETRMRLGDHRKACAEYRVTPDSKSYYEGYDQGLRGYCTPEKGRSLGEQGMYYHQVCPPDLEPAFLVQFNYGKDLYKSQQDVDNTKREINKKEDSLKKENDANVRKALREEIAALDRALSALQRADATLRANPPK